MYCVCLIAPFGLFLATTRLKIYATRGNQRKTWVGSIHWSGRVGSGHTFGYPKTVKCIELVRRGIYEKILCKRIR